ncbi:MAG TPA: hypothetical protein ENF65_00540 [Euryarchaeota archaeon]|nr:MAG: hypothetical protein DRN46_04560 [Thermococci archaeon]RLF97097.1 MAG: hypothetical protein DRN52_01145 [Thermococci archaeon]HDI10214.1 hypothetical protein [Euryarchaeota archaeon]
MLRSVSTKAEARLELPLGEKAKVIYKAILPEVKSTPYKRGRVSLKVVGESLVIDVQAEDTSALRATLNSYLRWVIVSLEVLELVK